MRTIDLDRYLGRHQPGQEPRGAGGRDVAGTTRIAADGVPVEGASPEGAA